MPSIPPLSDPQRLPSARGIIWILGIRAGMSVRNSLPVMRESGSVLL